MRKVSIITGGSSGIGEALVHKFAKEGYAVVFTGRDEDRLAKVQKESRDKYHDDIHGFSLDAAIEEDNGQLVAKTIEIYGKIDVLVCNAGVTMRALFSDLKMEVFRKVMDINFYGPLYLTKIALPHIIESDGDIIAISSVNGLRSTPARSAYSASKFAMEGFYETLRTELLPTKVNVLVVNPGFTQSKIRKDALNANGDRQGESPKDESKMMMPEQVANLTFKAFRKRKRNLVLTSTGRWLHRLNFFFPRQIDKIVYKVFTKEPDSPLK